MVFVTFGPNEAMVISGTCLALLICKWPFRAKDQCINVITIIIDSVQVYSLKGAQVTVQAVAQVNSRACQQFLRRKKKLKTLSLVR